MVNLSDQKKADAEKIHAEINQLRNQQFLICSFALGAVAAVIPVVSTIEYVIHVALIILSILFLWFYTLLKTHARLAVYLKINEMSVWESDYDKYSKKYEYSGQRKIAVLFFGVLALVLLAMGAYEFFSKFCSGDRKIDNDSLVWLGSLFAFLVSYYILLHVFGRDDRYDVLQREFEVRWSEILEIEQAVEAESDISKLEDKIISLKNEHANWIFISFLLLLTSIFMFFFAFAVR